MQLNSADLKKLYDEKKYSEIIDIIENKVSRPRADKNVRAVRPVFCMKLSIAGS